MATQGDRISSRSITNYERNVADARNWILPHRPVMQTLSEALNLDPLERRALVQAWNETKEIKDSLSQPAIEPGFLTAGRESIIDQVLEGWELARNGSPQFVMLGGAAGIGKTTLARHLSDRIAASSKRVLISWGESHSWASPIDPYLAVRHATDRLLVPPPESLTLPGNYPNRAALPISINQHVIESFPHLGGVLISEGTFRALADQSDQLESQFVQSVLNDVSATASLGRWEEYGRLLIEITQASPVLLVLEDIHWSSNLSASLLRYLVDHLSTRADVPLMIVGTFRSDELSPAADSTPHPLSQFLQGVSHLPTVSQIHMQQTLTEQNGKTFIRALLDSTPIHDKENEDELVNWLFDNTSGLPMLVLETIRHLRDTGALSNVPRSNSWQFVLSNVSRSVPTAISSLFQQRLSQVDRKHRYILEVASAMNESILTEVMADVMGIDEDTLLDQMDTVLVDRFELLRPGQLSKIANRSHHIYRFPHALLKEYIYSEIRPTRKRNLHLDIAESLGRIFATTDVVAMGEITHHHIMAEDWHSAQMSAYRVAQLQTGRLDWELASVWFKQAEELSILAEDARQLWRTRAAKLVVMRGLNLYQDALDLGENILGQSKIHGWRHTGALAHHHMGEIYYDLGQLDLAVEHIETALAVHIDMQTYVLAAAAEAMLSHATYRQGKYDVAREHARRSMAYTQETHNSWVRSEAMLAAANCEVDLGFYREAINNYRSSIELATMSGKLSNQFLPGLNIGLAYTRLGEYEQAITQISETLERMKSVHVPRTFAWGQLYLGFALEGKGDLEAALEWYTASASARRQQQAIPLLYDSVAAQLSAAIGLGYTDDVRSYTAEITDYIDENGLEGLEDAPYLLLTVARGFEALGDDAEYWRRLLQANELVLGRAALIRDTEACDSYLTRVPTNAEILRRINDRKNN